MLGYWNINKLNKTNDPIDLGDILRRLIETIQNRDTTIYPFLECEYMLNYFDNNGHLWINVKTDLDIFMPSQKKITFIDLNLQTGIREIRKYIKTKAKKNQETVANIIIDSEKESDVFTATEILNGALNMVRLQQNEPKSKTYGNQLLFVQTLAMCAKHNAEELICVEIKNITLFIGKNEK